MIWLCARKNSKLQTPDAAHQLPEHKNPDFVLEKPENEGPEGQKSTKTSILCSKRLKMRVPEGKSAQKPRFCAREARKRGSRRPNKHKNLDFVLETPENRASRPQKRTKTPILCSKCPKTGLPKGKSAQKLRFCARNARKRGFHSPKKHKNPNFVLERIGIGTEKRGNWHRETQKWHRES